MGSLRHLSRLRQAWAVRTCQPQRRWAQRDAGGEAVQPFNKREYDAQRYGGFKGVDKLFAEPQKKTVVGRWDWHLWNFLLALIPPGAVVLLAQWARRDMMAKQQKKDQRATEEMVQMIDKAQQMKEGQAATQGQPKQTQQGRGAKDESAELKERLAELEATVKALAAMQSAPSTAGAANGAAPDPHVAATASSLPPAAPPSEGRQPMAGPAANASTPAAPGAAAGHPAGKAPPLPKLPDNPLDKLLPETDCQFCNDTRQKLWGSFKSATGFKSAYDKQQAAKAAPDGAAPTQLRSAEAATAAAAEKPAASAVDQPVSEASAAQEAPGSRPAGSAASAAEPEAAQREPGAAGPSSPAAAAAPAPADPADPMTQQASSEGGAAGVKASAAPATAATPAAPAAAASSGGSAPPSTTYAHDKAPPLPKLPDNPLDRWLPETDCQFCNDTRQKLWAGFKNATGFKSAYDKQQTPKAAAADEGSQ